MAGALALALCVGLAGCKSTPKHAEEHSSTGSEWSEGSSERSESSGMEKHAKSKDLETIYFDFDRYDIRNDARHALRSNAGGLKGVGNGITIEGHCDERGAEEYNLALGERRANATKRYLVDLGVPASKLRTVSFGESRPAVQGHDESAWRWNRRAEFRLKK